MERAEPMTAHVLAQFHLRQSGLTRTPRGRFLLLYDLAMTGAPTPDQITAALKRAKDAARELTTHPERLLRHPQRPPERIDERWWLIGHIRVLGQAEEWQVLFDPVTDEGRLRASRNASG